MTRFKDVPVAIAAVVLSAGVAFAYKALPEAAATGLDTATEAAERTVPARPDPIEHAAPADATTAADGADVDLPDAAAHGADVSAAATADDPTPDTNRGADVSEVARDNAGAAAVEEHKPADAGPPDDLGPPDAVELPGDAPEDPGPPADPGQPEEPGRPN